MIKKSLKNIHSLTKSINFLTGAQATGNLHLGNYLGFIKNTINLQEKTKKEENNIIFIADLHSLSDIYLNNYSDISHKININENAYQMVAFLLASGIDPEKTKLFLQSQIPFHTELYLLLSSITPMHFLNRMTQFKTKRQKGSTLGLFSYPILMSSDIILYNPKIVPVGNDQNQHMEMTRELTKKLNSMIKTEKFNVPETSLSKGNRIMSLDNAFNKMSKSSTNDSGRINLLDSFDEIVTKIKKCYIDDIEIVTNDLSRKQLNNLIQIYASLSNKSNQEVYNEFENKKISIFKDLLSELIIEELGLIQDEYFNIIDDREYVESVLKQGKYDVLPIGYNNLKCIKEVFGIYQ